MSQRNPIRVFVTHTWQENDDYIRVFEYLESARNFYYVNLSHPEHPPARTGSEDQREELRRQMGQAEVVIAQRERRHRAGDGLDLVLAPRLFAILPEGPGHLRFHVFRERPPVMVFAAPG